MHITMTRVWGVCAALWVMNCSLPFNPFPTDEILLASHCSTVIFMADDQVTYIPCFHQFRSSWLGPTIPHTLSRHPHSLHVPLEGSKFHLDWFFSRTVVMWNKSWGDASLIAAILTFPSWGSIIIYSPYNVYLLLPLCMPLKQPHLLFTLSGYWALYQMSNTIKKKTK